MTYATRRDLESRFGAAEIFKLADGADGGTRIAAVLADAAAEIDGRLASAFRLPLPAGAWPMLLRIQCDLARGLLYDDAPPDRVSANAAAARKQLGDVADGSVRLVDSQGRPAVRVDAGTATPGRRTFTRDRLGGW